MPFGIFKSRSAGVVALDEIPLKSWTPENFRQWLNNNKYDKKTVIDVLVKQQFDGASIMCFTVQDLSDCGIPKGSALSIYGKIQELKQNQIQSGLLTDSTGQGGLVNNNNTGSSSSSNSSFNNNNSNNNNGNKNYAENNYDEIEELDTKPSTTTTPKLNENYSNNNNNNDKNKTEEEMEYEREFARDLEDKPATITTGTSMMTSRSTASNVQSFNQVPEAPLWNTEDFSNQQKYNYDYCLQKLEHLREQQFDSNVISTICQNLVFAERFRYKYLNPARLPVYENRKPQEAYMKVKMVVTEMADGQVHKFVRRFGSLFKHSTIQQMEYGMFHTALIIGPWYIEWGDSSIAVVRAKSSAKAVFAVDVCKITTLEQVAKTIDKIASICAHWNAHKMYDNKTCNCQHFVMSVLDYLGIRNDLEKNLRGPLRVYMDRLKNDGVCDMRYHLDPTIKELILNSDCSDQLKKMVSGKSIVFTTHKLLDEFVLTVQKHKPLYFDSTGKLEYMLLKSFDRAFWLRAQSSKEQSNPNVLPMMDEYGESLCPFNNIDQNNNTVVGKDYEVEEVKIPMPHFRKK
ncbi:hypothetical protein ABK040_014781 [Willaertia magna]